MMLNLVTRGFPSWPTNSIQQGFVPDEIQDVISKGVLWQVAPNRFLLRVPLVAKYLVEEGRQVTVDPAPEADQTSVNRYFLMAPLAAMMYQRGRLVFHAAAAAQPEGMGEKAILITGDSAAGKSTLLVALQQRGWRILNDELSIVVENEEGQPGIMPISQEVLLWEDALDKLDLGERPLPNKMNVHANGRWAVEISLLSEEAEVKIWPVGTIFRLSLRGHPEIELERLEGMKTFQALGTMIYNSHIADAILSRQDYLRQAGKIAQQVPVFHLKRPRGQWSVEALADRVESIMFGNGGAQHGDL